MSESLFKRLWEVADKVLLKGFHTMVSRTSELCVDCAHTCTHQPGRGEPRKKVRVSPSLSVSLHFHYHMLCFPVTADFHLPRYDLE